eukprot:GILI01012154.1.p1 GENE.GILI01012154.1~~GILI01012154.1.p1  ORF type:complete len:454 (+),score=43.98 GILI01012154.1:85-1362(+)
MSAAVAPAPQSNPNLQPNPNANTDGFFPAAFNNSPPPAGESRSYSAQATSTQQGGGGGGQMQLNLGPKGSNSSASAKYPEIRVGQRFRLTRRIGGGAFGEVYEGYDTTNGDSVAVKLEPLTTNHHPHLHHEARLYSYLNRGVITVGLPRLRWFAAEGDYNVLVMDLLGPSIEELFEYCRRQFDLKSVYMIIEQMIQRLEYMHAMQYLHRDIKPENFVMGLGRRAHHVYVIDLGLAKRFWDPKVQKHIPFVSGKQLTGTARYVSLATHLGHQQARKDDLESVAYVALYLAKGQLPWQGYRCSTKQEKYDRIMAAKQNTPIQELCSDLPEVFEKYLRYCRGLEFEEKPDYSLCKAMWEEALLVLGPRDYDFSWLKKRRADGESSSVGSFSQTNTAVHMSGFFTSRGSSMMQPSYGPGSPMQGSIMRR